MHRYKGQVYDDKTIVSSSLSAKISTQDEVHPVLYLRVIALDQRCNGTWEVHQIAERSARAETSCIIQS